MLNSENVSFLTVALLIYAYENDGQIDVFKFMEDTEYSEPAIMDTLEQMQLLELVTQNIPFHLTAYGHTVTERYYKKYEGTASLFNAIGKKQDGSDLEINNSLITIFALTNLITEEEKKKNNVIREALKKYKEFDGSALCQEIQNGIYRVEYMLFNLFGKYIIPDDELTDEEQFSDDLKSLFKICAIMKISPSEKKVHFLRKSKEAMAGIFEVTDMASSVEYYDIKEQKFIECRLNRNDFEIPLAAFTGASKFDKCFLQVAVRITINCGIQYTAQMMIVI